MSDALDQGALQLQHYLLGAKLFGKMKRKSNWLPVEHSWIYARDNHQWGNMMYCLKHLLRRDQ